MDQSPDYADRLPATPADAEPSSAVRGWQSLAEKRGAELAAARAELDAYKAAEAARHLATEFPDAAELVLRDGGQLSPAMAGELAATQRGIDAARASYVPRMDANNPRKVTTPQAPETIADLEREAGDMLARHLESRF